MPARILTVVGRVEVVVFLLAAVFRALVVVSSGALRANFGYDAAVYFAGSDALTFGRMPYRDFVYLHPPGELLALAPWAALTRVLDDPTSFLVANLSMALVGATNAVLVVRVCRYLGLGGRAALVGGLFYATWFGAVGAEYLTKLEPVGNLFFLTGLLLALRARRAPGAWLGTAAGAALGLAVCVKIWWVVPVAAVVVWCARGAARPRRALALLGSGVVGAGLVVTAPFFLAAPGPMWSSVVVAQLGRHPSRNPLPRLADLGTFIRLDGPLPGSAVAAGTVLTAAVFLLVVLRAWSVTGARGIVVVLGLQLVVLLAAPSWFPYYCDYLAGSMAVTVAAAAAPRPHLRIATTVADWMPTVLVSAVTLVVLATGAAALRPLPGAEALARSVAGSRCVMSDAPMALIELDALSRGLAAGCPNWVDVTGRTYGPDRASGPRATNARWQTELTQYLRSGDAVTIFRRGGTGVSPSTQAAISRDGVLAHAGGQTVYRIRHP
ncbi:hypothetical protein RKE38_18165 [Phycicoccus sp. M110.8]|uniref:hypothetical protein n=1 Tax=Phycicoccus sp. M110.8 TaxID=3075433 RepID=UPI0028FD1F96|nr:hypothetical protein [Phycicoccus sp. M110.8]MDU0315629.1 hypothetical protein [Phycicoccus sp. M110.8]